jgi:hypothetical protein
MASAKESKKNFSFFGVHLSFYTSYLVDNVRKAIKELIDNDDYKLAPIHLANNFSIFEFPYKDDKGTHKRNFLHVLHYGYQKRDEEGRINFIRRDNNEEELKKQWGLPILPFKLVKEILEEHNLFLVDNNFDKSNTEGLTLELYRSSADIAESIKLPTFHRFNKIGKNKLKGEFKITKENLEMIYEHLDFWVNSEISDIQNFKKEKKINSYQILSRDEYYANKDKAQIADKKPAEAVEEKANKKIIIQDTKKVSNSIKYSDILAAKEIAVESADEKDDKSVDEKPKLQVIELEKEEEEVITLTKTELNKLINDRIANKIKDEIKERIKNEIKSEIKKVLENIKINTAIELN